MSLINYLKTVLIAHEIHIQIFPIICCQIPLPVSLLSVILVMICIPVALGWSGLVPIDATCLACWARLHWAAVFSPLLHCFTGRWFLSPRSPTPTTFNNNICLFQQCTNATFFSTGLVIRYLHCTLRPIKRSRIDTLQQWAQFTDSINYASKNMSWNFTGCIAVRAVCRLNSKQNGSP